MFLVKQKANVDLFKVLSCITEQTYFTPNHDPFPEPKQVVQSVNYVLERCLILIHPSFHITRYEKWHSCLIIFLHGCIYITNWCKTAASPTILGCCTLTCSLLYNFLNWHISSANMTNVTALNKKPISLINRLVFYIFKTKVNTFECQ